MINRKVVLFVQANIKIVLIVEHKSNKPWKRSV